MPSTSCSYVWPVSVAEADLIPPYVRLEHTCALDAGHVDQVLETRRDEHGALYSYPVPHRCHCGSWQPA